MEKETWKKPQLGDVAGGGQMALQVRSELEGSAHSLSWYSLIGILGMILLASSLNDSSLTVETATWT